MQKQIITASVLCIPLWMQLIQLQGLQGWLPSEKYFLLLERTQVPSPRRRIHFRHITNACKLEFQWTQGPLLFSADSIIHVHIHTGPHTQTHLYTQICKYDRIFKIFSDTSHLFAWLKLHQNILYYFEANVKGNLFLNLFVI